MSNTPRDHWSSEAGAEAYAGKYKRSIRRRIGHAREMAVLQRLLADVDARPPLLDCPVGAGRLVPYLLTVGSPITGVDQSEEMVKATRRLHHTAIEAGDLDVQVGDAAQLPFATDAFHTAVCHRLLHHIREPEQRVAILRELARVARAVVVVSYWDATTLRHRMSRRKHRRVALTPEMLRSEAAAAELVPLSLPRRVGSGFTRQALMAFAVERRDVA